MTSSKIKKMISIIVPVFNSEKTLKRCIDSILNQSYVDFELLLIDDGSIDASGIICDNYSSNDSRIRVFHKINGGVSSARNLGLNQAKGEWIAFVDSDDWLDSYFLQTLISGVKSDLSISTAKIEYLDIDDYYEICFPRGTYTNWGDILQNPDNHLMAIYVWGKLFKKQIIDDYNIRFDIHTSLGEDVLFVYEYILHINTFSFMDNTFIYHYCSNEGLSSKKFEYDVIDQSIIKTLDFLNEFEKKWKIDLEWRQMDVISSYLKKYKMPSMNVFYNDLHIWRKREYMSLFVNDKKCIKKGRRRKLFCVLYQFHFFFLIVLLKNIFK